MEEGQLIELYQGDGVMLYFPFVDNKGTPYPLANHITEFCIYSQSKKEVILSKEMTIDATNIARVKLDPVDTADLTASYQYLVRVKNGNQYTRIVTRGQIKFTAAPLF